MYNIEMAIKKGNLLSSFLLGKALLQRHTIILTFIGGRLMIGKKLQLLKREYLKCFLIEQPFVTVARDLYLFFIGMVATEWYYGTNSVSLWPCEFECTGYLCL